MRSGGGTGSRDDRPRSVSDGEEAGVPEYDLAVTSPFERTATFTLELPSAAEVRLRIFDPTGRLVSEIAGGRYEPGLRRWEWDARDHPAGVYLYELAVGREVRAGRIVRIR